jgi:hypothetical protein
MLDRKPIASAFFDELGNILEEREKVRDENMQPNSERPYSSTLTQNEEPGDYHNPAPIEEGEPEVITRGS